MRRTEKSHVLFVGGGRRVGLATAFADRGATVSGYEINASESPLHVVAHGVYEGLPFDHPDFLEDIKQVCRRAGVTKIVPLMDEAAVLCGDLPGCIGSSASVARLCWDKLHFANWMKRRHPALYPSPGLLRYPKFAKPRFGHGARRARPLHRPETIEASAAWVVQDFLAGDEVSVDLFVRGGVCLGGVARSRDRVEGGEVIESRVLSEGESAPLVEAASAVAVDLGINGPANVQFKGGKIMEVNARFGGGCVLSIAAGLDLVSMALGRRPRRQAIHFGMGMRRYHSEVFSR